MHNLPPQTRHGLFQCLVSNFKAVWTVRSDPNVRLVFKTLYSNLRGKTIRNYIVSADGINFKPGTVGPNCSNSKRDWAHVDQTSTADIFQCVQGQVVLANTTAGFVATPGSHILFKKILDELGIDSKSNWLKFTPEQLVVAKEIIENNGGKWQIPILAPKGSMIVWASSLIHSAKLQDRIEKPLRTDKYNGWRAVVYVCYRPKSEFTPAQTKKRIMAFEANRHTNHWSIKLMSKKPGSHFIYRTDRHADIMAMIDNPVLVYDKIGKPVLSERQKKLIY